MFEKLVGNNPVKTVLRRLIVQKRVPNSLLFAGADGIGKKQFALEIAKSFVCQNPQNFEACDHCDACRRAARFNFPKSDDRDAFKKVIFSQHADIGQVVPYHKNILVDAIRDLEKEANFRPFVASARFFIVDDADRMNASASNALLKTLEEPDAKSYIFLITSRPDALLPTIRSRCQTIRFAPMQPIEIENYLLQTKRFAHDDAALLARLADGKLARALQIDLGNFREQRETMLKVLENILIKPDRAELLRVGENLNDAKNKDDYESSLEILQTLIHDVLTLLTEARDRILVNGDILTDLRRLAVRAENRRLAAWLGEIEFLRGELAFNLNRKIAADALLMRMAG